MLEMSIQLKPVRELPKSKRAFKSEYDDTITKFLADDSMRIAEVAKEGIKTSSLASILKGRVKKNFKDQIDVAQREGKVFLVKKTKKVK